MAAAMRPIQLGRAVKQRSLSLSESFGAALACDKSLEIERRRLSARFALYESRPRRRKLGFLFFNKPQGGMHDVGWRIVAILGDLRFDKRNEVVPEIETGSLVHLAFSTSHNTLFWPRVEAAPQCSRILRDAVAKRPILLRNFQKIH